MKKRYLIFFMFIFLFVIISTTTNVLAEITGETITGEATGSVSMNITITAITPTLTIISPQNKTYLTNQSILLNYTANNANNIWYFITNSPFHQINTTISSFMYFSVPQGSHTLWLYANNSQGITTKNVTFFVNNTLFNISYGKYSGAYAGSSTNFTQHTYEEMQNMSNLILEHTSYGKILFNQLINLTDDTDPNDNQIDINSYTNLSSNRIEINLSALPNFNKSATLSLYGLNFSDPRILIDDVVCPSTICTQQNYLGGVLIFNVTHFTTYSSEETPREVTLSPGGGGCRYGWSCTEWSKCSFTGKQTRDCANVGSCFDNYNPPQIEQDCEYIAPEGELFDVTVSILPGEKTFVDSKKVSFKIDIIKFKLLGEISKVKASYGIRKGLQSIVKKTEELEIQKQISIIRTMDLPKLAPGVYEIHVEIAYKNEEPIKSTTSFIVREREKNLIEKLSDSLKTTKTKVYLLIILFIAVLIITEIIIIIKHKKKKIKWKR